MHWHWPQWAYAILIVLTFACHVTNAGQPRDGTYANWDYFLSLFVVMAILYFGGFWTPSS